MIPLTTRLFSNWSIPLICIHMSKSGSSVPSSNVPAFLHSGIIEQGNNKLGIEPMFQPLWCISINITCLRGEYRTCTQPRTYILYMRCIPGFLASLWCTTLGDPTSIMHTCCIPGVYPQIPSLYDLCVMCTLSPSLSEMASSEMCACMVTQPGYRSCLICVPASLACVPVPCTSMLCFLWVL
jgi:hypothetical protein